MPGLEWAGLKIDEARNQQTVGREGLISTDDSRLLAYAIPTDEELLIARDTVRVILGEARGVRAVGSRQLSVCASRRRRNSQRRYLHKGRKPPRKLARARLVGQPGRCRRSSCGLKTESIHHRDTRTEKAGQEGPENDTADFAKDRGRVPPSLQGGFGLKSVNVPGTHVSGLRFVPPR